jgi:hypothetical protein
MTEAVEHAGSSTARGPVLHEGDGPVGKALDAACAWREAVGNWLTCEIQRRSLAQAPERADALVRARVLLTEAARTVRQPKPEAAAVLALAREALRWCLAAVSGPDGNGADTLAVHIAALSGNEQTRALALMGPLGTGPIPSDAELLSAARLLFEESARRLHAGGPTLAKVDSIVRCSLVRTWAARALVVGLVAATAAGGRAAWLGPDLAPRAAWRTSSVLFECHPKAHLCGDTETDIFFHTNVEPDPWIRYDLGASVHVHRVEVRNRTDLGGDRAVPLVVELSDDDVTYREVGRQNDSFTEWAANFSRQRARYVRLRALKVTPLHLERVAIR